MNYDVRSLWRISFPVIVSMLLQQLIGITDVIYLGRLSSVALGASALGSTYFFSFFVLIAGFTFGAQIIISRRNGEGNFKKIGAVFYQGLFFLLICAVFLIAVSRLFSPRLLQNLIREKSVLEATLAYTDWRIFGLISTSFLMMFRAFFVGIAKTFVLQFISVVMLGANIILNYVLIFGFGFIKPLGIEGAAIASVLAELLAVLACIIYFIFKVENKKFGLDKIVWKNFKLLKSILDLSIWTMLQQFASVASWFMFFVAVEHLGATNLAIANILKNSAGIPWIIVVSFGATAGTVTGNLIGENRTSEVLVANKQIIKLNTVVIFGLLVLFSAFYYPILRIYTNDYDLIHQAIPAYLTALLCYIPLFSGWIWFQAVSATGHTKYTMFIELIAMVFYTLFIATFILYLRTPLYICMLSDGLYNLVVYIFSKRYMVSLKWQGKKF